MAHFTLLDYLIVGIFLASDLIAFVVITIKVIHFFKHPNFKIDWGYDFQATNADV